MGTRRKSREIAIQILYQFEMNRTDLDEGIKLFWAEHPNSKEVSNFVEYLVRGVNDNKDEIDSIIVSAASNWSL